MSEDKLVPTVRTALAVASPGPWKLRPRDVAFDQWPEEEWDRRALGWSDEHFLQFDIEGPAPVFGRGDFNGGDAVLVTHAVEWLTSLCERVEALEKDAAYNVAVGNSIRRAHEALKAKVEALERERDSLDTAGVALNLMLEKQVADVARLTQEKADWTREREQFVKAVIYEHEEGEKSIAALALAQRERDRYRETNESVAVCANHTEDILSAEECVVCARQKAEADAAAVRELMNVYNLGGWTDSVGPMKRALQAEAALAALKADVMSLSHPVCQQLLKVCQQLLKDKRLTESALAALETLANRYARHDSDCDVTPNHPKRCRCGYLAAVRAALGEGRQG